MNELIKKIGYKFKNLELLKTAITHSSYANESKELLPYNERLEFLGDAVLSIVVSDYLFNNIKELSEGQLTKTRASLVCEKSLSAFASKIMLGSFLFLGKGEKNTGGSERPSILADAFEAVIAAIYLDGGMKEARKFVLKFIIPELKAQKRKPFKDYKTDLQEIVQQNPEEQLTYVLANESGPDHNKRFEVEVRLNNNTIGKGSGKSKKEAEQRAAHEALILMGY